MWYCCCIINIELADYPLSKSLDSEEVKLSIGVPALSVVCI